MNRWDKTWARLAARRAARLVLLVPLLAAGCDLLGFQKSCTAIGCVDGASITIRRAEGMTPPYAVVLSVDGRRVTCPAPERGSHQSATCDGPVSVAYRETADCHEERTAGAVSQSCVPNGKFEQVIGLSGTPTRVAITLSVGDTVAAERTFDLTYVPGRPNGPDCEPICHRATADWVLP